MKILFRAFYGPADWGWVNQQVPILRSEDTCGIMAIDTEKNETVGACIMDNFTDNSVQCHFMITSAMVLRHGFIEECGDFVFNHSDKEIMYGLVPGNNEKAIKLNQHMGFTIKCRLEDAFAKGVDYLIMEARKENFIYLPKKQEAA